MSAAQKVFDNEDLKEYILSFLYSFDKIIEVDKVSIFDLHKDNPKFTRLISEETMNTAAEYSSFNIIKWLHYNRSDGCTEYAMDIAADKGNLEILEWLHINRDEGCSIDALMYAIENEHLHVVIWLHENRLNDIPQHCYKVALNEAAQTSNLEILNYLYNKYIERFNNEHECFTHRIVNIVAMEGNIKIMEWLHNHCNWYNYKEIACAAKYGSR